MKYSQRIKADRKLHVYDRTVIEFCNNGGRFLLCTGDLGFVKALRYALEQVGIDYRNHLTELDSYDNAVTLLARQQEKLKTPMVAFLERRMGSKSCIKALKVIKEFYSERVRVVVVSEETGREEIVLIFEVGADSLIIKPISANAIIEKIAFAIKPNNELSVLFDRANELLAQGDLDSAERIAERVFSLKPDSLAGHILLGDVATERGNFDDAKTHYHNAAKSERLYVKPLQRLAELCEKAGDKEGRLEYLGRLEKLSPLNYERKIEIGEAYLELDDLETANKHFQEATKVVKRVADEMVSDSLMRIAKTLAVKDKEQALAYMNEAIDLRGTNLNKGDLWMFNERGIILRQQGRWEDAIENYRKALLVAPDDGGLYYNIGVAFAVGKQHRKAVQAFVKAVETDQAILEQSPAVPYNISLSYVNIGNRDNALQMLRMALKVDADYPPAQRLLAKLEAGA